ncbi:hypothetical protein [Streptomyces sp. NPDC003006]
MVISAISTPMVKICPSVFEPAAPRQRSHVAVDAGAQQCRFGVPAPEEHEQQQAHLGDGGQQPEQARPEGDPRRDLGGDGRLTYVSSVAVPGDWSASAVTV